ncbi:hypothetical protein SAMN04487914_12338 [Arthrobacter sp. ok909]|uniref:DUF6262 family protein n=1 Tax=Arthrobacter sp. ok909 TaxID=1761746 RepID=UPI00088BDE68|nr:DUF6262 family protein [Arthrobacter sp. ok909]SDP65006.1 hypothetical protein SAMN04487914_12338 [Arthrobacter sp. ok909]
MRADNSRYIRQAAERRHELTRSKAVAALRELQNQGGAVTFEAVAAAAGVSRSWLYTQADLRADIVGLRDDRPQEPRASRSSASTESLRARLNASLERNRELSTEIEHLRHQLALALGHARRRNEGGS